MLPGGGTTSKNDDIIPSVKAQSADEIDQQNDEAAATEITPEKVTEAIGNQEYTGKYSITSGGTYVVKAGTYSYTKNTSSSGIGLIQVGADAPVTIKIEDGVTVDSTQSKYLICVEKGDVTIEATGANVTLKNYAGFLQTNGSGNCTAKVNGGAYTNEGSRKNFLYNNDSNAEITLNGLSVTNGTIMNDNGTVVINSGSYKMTSGSYGDYSLKNTASCKIYGGIFDNNVAVTVWNNGTLNIEEQNGEKIEIKNSATGTYDSAIYCSNYSTTNLNSGTVQANGTAIYVGDTSTAVSLNLNGGIVKNSQKGVFVQEWWDNYTQLKVGISGTQFIGNTADVYLAGTRTYSNFQIAETRKQNLKVKVETALWPGDTRTIVTDANAEELKALVTSVDGYDVGYDAENKTIYLYCETLNTKDITNLPTLVEGTDASGEGWSWKENQWTGKYILTVDAGYALNLPEDEVHTIGAIMNNGVIKSGNFKVNNVSNDGMITGGTFKTESIWNDKLINGGTFDTEDINGSGTINGGVFKNKSTVTGGVEVTGENVDINGLGDTVYVLCSEEYPQKITAKYTGTDTIAKWKMTYGSVEEEYFASGKVTHAAGEMELSAESLKAELTKLTDTLKLTPVEGALYELAVTKGRAMVNGASVTRAAEGAPVELVPEDRNGETFVEWSKPDDLPDWDERTDHTASFTMPAKAVEISAVFEQNQEPTPEPTPDPEPTPEPTPEDGADVGGAVAAVMLTAGAGWAGYELGLYLYKNQMGIAYWPENRLELAKTIWEKAGRPVPESTALYDDIDADDNDAQQAAHWVVEQGLLAAKGNADENFEPAKPVSRLRTCLTWQNAREKGLID